MVSKVRVAAASALVLAFASFGIANAQSGISGSSVPSQRPAGPDAEIAPAAPAAEVKKFPLRIVNYGSKPVEAWIDGGLKCKLPAGYQCNLQVPDGRHSLHLVRPGSIYNDAFALPDLVAGKQYDGAMYLIRDDRIDYAPGIAR